MTRIGRERLRIEVLDLMHYNIIAGPDERIGQLRSCATSRGISTLRLDVRGHSSRCSSPSLGTSGVVLGSDGGVAISRRCYGDGSGASSIHSPCGFHRYADSSTENRRKSTGCQLATPQALLTGLRPPGNVMTKSKEWLRMASAREYAIVATHIVLISNGLILLQRRTNTGYEDGSFSLPAGHVEQSESVVLATRREAKEELGISCAPEDLRLVHVMHRSGVAGAPPRVDFFMACRAWSGDPQIMEPLKADALRWAPLASLPGNTVPYIAEAMAAIQGDVVYSELGWTASCQTVA